MRTSALITLAALLTLPSIAGAEVYTWKDASGKTIYSDKPPLETKAPTRELKSPKGSGGTPAPTPAKTEGGGASAANGTDGVAASGKSADQQKAEADARAKLCDNARKRLIQLESEKGILLTKNEKGESVPLVGDARAAETDAARKEVEQWCK